MSLRIFLYSQFVRLLPETRCYLLKAKMLSRCGFDICRTARIVSSARFAGSFNLAVGDDTFIGHDVLVAGGKCSINIGNACDIGPRVTLIAGSHEIDMEGAHTAGKGYSHDIVIESGVWIGACATVLGGVRIGSKSVIAAGSTVTQNIPPNVIAAGSPCRVIRIWDSAAKIWIQVEN